MVVSARGLFLDRRISAIPNAIESCLKFWGAPDAAFNSCNDQTALHGFAAHPDGCARTKFHDDAAAKSEEFFRRIVECVARRVHMRPNVNLGTLKGGL